MNMNGKLKIELQSRPMPAPDDRVLVVELDPILLNDAYQSLDVPHHYADPLSRSLCTSQDVIDKVTSKRRKLIAYIQDYVGELLMQDMGKNDTTMGYKDAD